MLLPDVPTVHSVLQHAQVSTAVVEQTGLGIVVRLDDSELHAALRGLRESASEYLFLVDLFGTDSGEGVELTYHLRSLSRDEELYLRIALPYGGAFASVWEIHPAALMPEREIAEMFELTLEGHPNPKRLLTPDGAEPFLLKRIEIRTPEEARDR